MSMVFWENKNLKMILYIFFALFFGEIDKMALAVSLNERPSLSSELCDHCDQLSKQDYNKFYEQQKELAYHQKLKPNCLWNKVKFSSKNYYLACEKNSKQINEMISYCLDEKEQEIKRNPIFLYSLRREQVSLIFVEDLNYMMRIPMDSIYFANYWQEFKKRWTLFIKNETELLYFDAKLDKSEGACSLSQLLGISCQNFPERNIFDDYINKSKNAYNNKVSSRKLPKGLLFDLLKANLIAYSYHTPIEKLFVRGSFEDSLEKQKIEIDELRRVSKDTVMGYWPELRMKGNLRSRLNELMQTYQLSEAVIREVSKIEFEAPATFFEREKIVNQIIAEKFSNQRLSASLNQEIEKLFWYSHLEIQDYLQQHMQKGQDKEWLLKQDYLISILMDKGISENNFSEIGYAQTKLCSLEATKKRYENQKFIGMTVASGLALATGVGSLIGIGGVVGSTLLANTSMILILGTSGFDVFDLNNEENHRKFLFTIHRARDSEVAESHNLKKESITMGLINNSILIPFFAVKSLATLHRLAEAKKEIEKAQHLERLMEKTEKGSHYMNAGMSVYMGKDAYHASKDLLMSEDDKNKIENARLKRREIREAAIEKRANEN